MPFLRGSLRRLRRSRCRNAAARRPQGGGVRKAEGVADPIPEPAFGEGGVEPHGALGSGRDAALPRGVWGFGQQFVAEPVDDATGLASPERALLVGVRGVGQRAQPEAVGIVQGREATFAGPAAGPVRLRSGGPRQIGGKVTQNGDGALGVPDRVDRLLRVLAVLTVQQHHRHGQVVVDDLVDHRLLGAVHRADHPRPDQETAGQVALGDQAGDPFQDPGTQRGRGLRSLARDRPLGHQRGQPPPHSPRGVVLPGQVDQSLAALLLLRRAAPPRGHGLACVEVVRGERVAVAEDDAMDSVLVEVEAQPSGLPGVQIPYARGVSVCGGGGAAGLAAPGRAVVAVDAHPGGVRGNEVEQQRLAQGVALDEDPAQGARPAHPERVHLAVLGTGVADGAGLDA